MQRAVVTPGPAKTLSCSTPLVIDSPRGAEVVVNATTGLEAMSAESARPLAGQGVVLFCHAICH